MAEQLIVEWATGELRFGRVDSHGRAKQLNWYANDLLNDPKSPPEEIGGMIKSWMSSEGIDGGTATLLLPRESIVVRQLQLPQAPEEEIPDIVKFQSAAKSSMPIDDLSLDYSPIHSGRDTQTHAVITFSCEKKLLTRIRNVLQFAGVEIERATISPLAICNFVSAFGGSQLGKDAPEMVIYQRGSLVEISILDRQSLVFSHSVTLPETEHTKPLESALTRSIVALNQTHPNVSIERCYLVGSEDTQVRDLLTRRFPDSVFGVSAAGSGTDTSSFESVIGAALPPPDKNLSIDLLNPRKKIEKPDRRKLYLTVGGAVAAAVLLMGYLYFRSQKGSLEQQIAEINSRIYSTDQVLKAGEPTLTAYGHIEEWTQAQTDIIVAWNELQSRFPGTGRVYLEDLRINPLDDENFRVSFSGTGHAKSRSDLEDLGDQLSRSGFEVTPNTPEQSLKDPDYPWTVRFDVNQLRKMPEKPAAKPDSKSQAAIKTTDKQSL